MDVASAASAVLSTTITPAVLLSAGGSLQLTTSRRLACSIERARALGRRLDAPAREPVGAPPPEGERTSLIEQMALAARRVRLLRRVMVYLYVSLSVIVLTSVAIGLLTASGLGYAWVPAVLGLTGVGLLFAASAYLLAESRIALVAVEVEIRALSRLGQPFKADEVRPPQAR